MWMQGAQGTIILYNIMRFRRPQLMRMRSAMIAMMMRMGMMLVVERLSMQAVQGTIILYVIMCCRWLQMMRMRTRHEDEDEGST